MPKPRRVAASSAVVLATALLCLGLSGLLPAHAQQASTIGRPFSGDAGNDFRYENLVVAQSRALTGTLINTAPRPRRDVVVEIIAIGLESREQVWSATQRFPEIPPNGAVDLVSNYGRFTAEPGAFTFKITESTAPPPAPEPAPSPAPAPVPDGAGEESPMRNVCSSVYTENGSYVIEGSDNCDTVSFPLEPGTARFEITRKGSGPIAATLLDNEKQPVAPLSSGSTYRTTKATAKIPQALRYRLQIAHAGKWTIRISGEGVQDLGGPSESASGGGPAASGTSREAPAKRFEIILE